MRLFLIAALSLAVSTPSLAQDLTEPATKDDVILLFRTMRSYDLVRKMMEVQSKSTQQLVRDQLATENKVPSDFDIRVQKVTDDLLRNMPVEEMTQAMIPAYQKHFTRGDMQAMNAFYSSAVGQKVLQELPVVTQESMEEMMPIISKYVSQWKARMEQEFKDTDNNSPKSQKAPVSQN